MQEKTKYPHTRSSSLSLKGNEYIQAKKEMDHGNLEMSLVFINLAINATERAIYYFFRGNIYEKLSKLEECYQDYKKAKELNQTDFTYYENLGRICKELGKYEEAIDLFTQVIQSGEINDDETQLASYYYEIGSIYDLLKKYEESYDFYLKAIDLDNKSAVNYQYKGNYLYLCNEFKSKLSQILETSYFNDVNSSKLFIENDYIYNMMNTSKLSSTMNINSNKNISVTNKLNLDEKILKYRKDLEAKPFDKSVWEKLAKCLKDAKNIDEAIIYFEKCYEKQKNNKLYLINLADCYLKKKIFHKTIFYADKLELLDKNYFKTYKIRSIAYFELNEMEKALKNIDKAINIQPDNYFSIEFKKKIKLNLNQNKKSK
jgi:tetratricopeptide (TPR) repeat protein